MTIYIYRARKQPVHRISIIRLQIIMKHPRSCASRISTYRQPCNLIRDLLLGPFNELLSELMNSLL